MSPHSVVLIGFMGCGKSSIARALARIVHLEVVDLDARIETEAGCTIAELFQGRGEEEFRRIESKALRESLGAPAIVATGGGVVTRDENRLALVDAGESGCAVVYLRAQPQTLAQRIRLHPGRRPLIDGTGHLNMKKTIARVGELLEQRELHYAACANMTIDTDSHSPYEIAQLIAEKLTQGIGE